MDAIVAALNGIRVHLAKLSDIGTLTAKAYRDLENEVKAFEARYVASMSDAERERYNRLRADDVPVLDALSLIGDERETL